MAATKIANAGGSPFLLRAYDSTNSDELAQVYVDWAATYDAEQKASEYLAPMRVAEMVARNTPIFSGAQVLDAGCGTGLCGIALATQLAASSSSSEAGNSSQQPNPSNTFIDGLDYVPAMLKVAGQTKLYRKLIQADLNVPLATFGIAESSYDIVTCVGTFTFSHVGPNALTELARATKPNGIMAITIVQDIYESGGYRAKIDKLVQNRVISVVENEVALYRKGTNTMANFLVLKKNPSATQPLSN